jgi:hypothetical protein
MVARFDPLRVRSFWCDIRRESSADSSSLTGVEAVTDSDTAFRTPETFPPLDSLPMPPHLSLQFLQTIVRSNGMSASTQVSHLVDEFSFVAIFRLMDQTRFIEVHSVSP